MSSTFREGKLISYLFLASGGNTNSSYRGEREKGVQGRTSITASDCSDHYER